MGHPGQQQLDTLLAAPDFATNVDRQQAALQVVLESAKPSAGGDTMLVTPWAIEAIGKLANALGMTPERVRSILAAGDLIALRRGLKHAQRPPAARLPHEAIFPDSGWLGAYVDSNLATEQPLAWHFWSAVSVLAAACRRSVYVDTGYHGVLFPSNFVFIVGPTGHGKSQAIHRATGILDAANRLALAECLTTGIDHRVVVAHVVTAQSTVDLLAPGDVFPEEVPGAILKREISAGLIANAEASTLLGRGRKEVSEQLVPFLTDAYDGEARLTATRGRGLAKLGAASISLLLGSTAEWLRTSMEESVFYGGFTGRCVFVERHTRDRLHYRDIPAGFVPDPIAERELARMLVPWLVTSPLELAMTPEAARWYAEWYVTHRESRPPTALLGPWWERKPAHLLKLAATLTVSDRCDPDLTVARLNATTSYPLPLSALELASKLLALEEGGMARLFEEVAQSPDTTNLAFVFERLERLYLAGGREPVAHFEWYRAVRARVGTNAKFRVLVSSLVEAGDVIQKVPASGRGQVYLPRQGLDNKPPS